MPESILGRMSKATVLRKWVGKPFLLVNEWAWKRLPPFIVATRPLRLYGSFLYSLVDLRSGRRQYHGTFFLRNRPELELIRALVTPRAKGSTLRLLVLACSNGAEVYSILWTIRSARPDLNVVTHAVDISNEILEVAKEGLYSLTTNKLIDSLLFERLTEEEMRAMFDRDKDQVRVKPWIKQGIDWQVADAQDPGLAKVFGPQDIVVANRFLCHMPRPEAERCLRNIAHLVSPGGYVFVSGVDLDLRTKIALDLGWRPVQDLLEEIHDGDPSVRRDWPWKYWGLEPFNPKRHNCSVRYASVFQVFNKE
jgi:SAM-dependent methyltransferase